VNGGVKMSLLWDIPGCDDPCPVDPCANPCPADHVPPGGDGQVSISDVNSMLSAYGLPCTGCPQDIVPCPGDNQVSIADINACLSAYGPCPP
jgi:hypothetical protein